MMKPKNPHAAKDAAWTKRAKAAEKGGYLGSEESISALAALLGQRGGKAKTPAKTAAARKNGKKGGWPKGKKRT